MNKLIPLLMAFLFFGCSGKKDNQENFNVTISVMVKETLKLWEYKIDNNEIKVTYFSTNNNPPQIKYQKKLTEKEQEKFSAFLKNFPLTDLKDNYSNSTTEGEQSLYFEITYDDFYKKIYVYYEYPEELKKLVKEINKYLPQENQFYF